MPAPAHRHAPRGSQFIRQWNLLIQLRRGAFTLERLAADLRCHKRTVMRDLEMLEAVGLPLERSQAGPTDPATWSLASVTAWPRDSVVPTKPLPEACQC